MGRYAIVLDNRGEVVNVFPATDPLFQDRTYGLYTPPEPDGLFTVYTEASTQNDAIARARAYLCKYRMGVKKL